MLHITDINIEIPVVSAVVLELRGPDLEQPAMAPKAC